jgi:hypothetical protein
MTQKTQKDNINREKTWQYQVSHGKDKIHNISEGKLEAE